MDQTVVFVKTFTERLEKYTEILSDNITSKQVMNEWSVYLETTVDQFGWQAIWKIPCSDCEKFNITYPTLALIFVDNINFESLIAKVKILTVQNEEEFCDSYTVLLCHLWPTEEQDETVCLNLTETSEALDNLRFFYKHLWRPWDEEDVESNWFKKCLVPRLKLYYSLKESIISKNLKDYYRLDLIESKEKYDKFKELQKYIEEDETDSFDQDIPNKILELYKSLVKLRSNLEIFENPYLRDVYKNKHNCKTDTPNFWLALLKENDYDGYMEFINNVKRFVNVDCKFKTARSLQEALSQASAGDTIFIGDGNHIVTSSKNLTDGGKIINVNYPKEATITTTNEYLLFNFKNGEIILENLTIQLNKTRYGIRVRNGAVLTLNNCIMQGYKNNSKDLAYDSLLSTQQAILSETGVVLHLNSCKFSYFGSVLFLNDGRVSMKNCSMNNIRCCLRLQDNVQATIGNCTFSHFNECFLHVQINKKNDDDDSDDENEIISGGIDLLESLPNINHSELIISEYDFPVIIISKKIQFRPVKNIFSNPAFNTSLNKTFDF